MNQFEDSGRFDEYLRGTTDPLDYETETGMIEFRGFPKIARLNRDIIITEKIDGTNAQVLVTDAGQVLPGSRKRWLTIEDDNYGFAAWVAEQEQALVKLGPGRHYGEWWGKGIQRNYGLDHRRFSLFNVSRWYDPSRKNDPVKWILSKEALVNRIIVPYCCYTVPVIYAGPYSHTAILSCLNDLRELGSHANPSFPRPEGIVIYHTAGGYLFKVTLENDGKPKEQK